MIKATIVLINFIGLFFLHYFTANNITIENIVPDNMAPGTPTLVEVTVTKNDVQGFAKMEIVLPEGFVATPGETKGGSFTFSDKKVRLVWMTLPTEPSFKVSYYLECPESMTGKYEARGTFSYINNNERIDYVIPTEHIFVSKDAAVTQTNASQEGQITEQTKIEGNANNEVRNNGSGEEAKPLKNTQSVDVAEKEQPETTNVASNSQELLCERRISRISDNEFRVDVRIVNSNIKGFAKIVENGPALSKTEKIQDAGATVTADKNTIKFVWFEIPNASVIEFSYKITTISALMDNPEVTGKLAFVENNNPKEIGIVNAGSGATSSPVLAQNNVKPVSPSPSKEVKDEKTQKTETRSNPNQDLASTKPKEVKESAKTPKEGAKSQANAANRISNTPSAEVGVNYKVQILAAHRVVNKTYFKQRHSFGEQFNIENHEGWVKYTTGKFEEYKNARDERERLKSSYNTLPGPFVTAYNNGERITVQEALLITKQQWYQ